MNYVLSIYSQKCTISKLNTAIIADDLISGLLWWEYLVIVITIFVGCVFLNYLVKVVNELRIEQKFQLKTSTNHSVQAQDALLMEPLNLNDESKLYTRLTFINKEENFNRSVQSLPTNGFSKKKLISIISDEVNISISLPSTQADKKITKNELKNWIQELIFDNFIESYDLI